MEDRAVPYRLQLRNYHPKRSQMHKIHRWRHVNNCDDLITKVLLCQHMPVFASIHNETECTGIPPISRKTSIKILNEIDNDWTGLSSGIIYSQKKKRRWLLPNLLEGEIPEYDEYNLPYELVSTAATRFQRHNTHCCSPSYWFYQPTAGNHKLNGSADNIKSLSMKMKDGKEFSFKGRANIALLKHMYKNYTAQDCDAIKLHVQFQSVELKKVPRLHDSRIYDYHPSWEEDWRDPVVFEAHHVGKDVATSGYLEDDDSLDIDEYWETFSPPSPVPKPLTFGDFVDVQNIPRKGRSSKSDLKEWVFI